jgi:hypothetical protein
MLRPNAWRVAWAVGLLAGCDSLTPSPRLTAVQPARSHTDRALRLQILGAELLPAWEIDLTTATRTGDARGFSGSLEVGATRVALREFSWLGPGQLSATLPPGLPAGRATLALRDPRGQPARLPGGFESLGADASAPVILFAQPAAGAATAPGARMRAEINVQDDSGLHDVRWELRRPDLGPISSGVCPLSKGASTIDCSFELAFPDQLGSGAAVELAVEATDEAGTPNVGRASRSFVLGPRPAVVLVSPARGGTAGGTEVVVRGNGFLAGSRVYFGRGLLQPQGGIRLDDQTITGRTPAHAEGGALVRVETPLGDARPLEGETLFEFSPPPVVRTLVPAVASAAGGTALQVTGEHFTADTRLLAGPSLRSAVPLAGQTVVSTTEIRGTTLPAAAGVRMTVFAVDPNTGLGALPDGLDVQAP